MRKTIFTILVAAVCTLATAQTVGPKGWGSLGAATRFSGTGLTLAYGQRDFFAPGTNARFGIGYFSNPYTYEGSGFALELTADALATTYDPAPNTGLALVAYGGLGPRLLVQTAIYDPYAYDGGTTSAYGLNVGGVGGLEARLGSFGILLEVDVSLPAFGLIGPRFRVFPFEVIPAPKLTLGANYYF